MNRKYVFAASGSKVAPCTTFAATVPPVTFAWYQRTVALFAFEWSQSAAGNTPLLTVCVTQSDSAPPRSEYCACAIARIASVSALLAGVDALLGNASGQQFGASCASGPVNVDAAMLFQSTWNL